MQPAPPRTVTLVLLDAAGGLLGALPPFEAATPWWNDMAPVVAAVQARDGLQLTVLRLLGAERPAGPGGAVTYLAQLDAGASVAPGRLQPWPGSLPDDARRLPYARPGGPAADLAWAQRVLAQQGIAPSGRPRQVRSWNLSSLWCLPTSAGPVWLKAVPPFFAHEAPLIALLAAAPVPRLLGHGGGRMLLAHIDGEDLYGAPLPQCLAMIDLLVNLQAAWLGRAAELVPLGLPDWRAAAMAQALAALVERRAGELDSAPRAALQRFVAGLPARFDALAACGLPDGLVHGDFHPGNLRGRGGALTLLDWGDSGVGHPLLDQPAFLDRMPAAGVAQARSHWAAAWQRQLPQADVAGAAALLAPIAAARQALIYQRFLDNIETSERPYHEADVCHWLLHAAAHFTDPGGHTR